MALSNSFVAGALAGVAGAAAVNVAHEITRRITPDAPRMDVIGMRALARVAGIMGQHPPEHLRTATFAGDLISNSLYYGLVGAAGREYALPAGAALGTIAGSGGVLLPPRLGLGTDEVNRTRKTQVLTVALYLAGGLIAGLTYRSLVRKP